MHDVSAPSYVPVNLPYNLDAVSDHNHLTDGNFDGQKATYPAEMLTERVSVGGVEYKLGSFVAGKPNAIVADGQVIALPRGYSRVFILASAIGPREKIGCSFG